MSKAILILDEMPLHCSDCPCFDSRWGECNVTDKEIDTVIALCGKRPDWCPIKESED